jgi:cell division protein FtsB
LAWTLVLLVLEQLDQQVTQQQQELACVEQTQLLVLEQLDQLNSELLMQRGQLAQRQARRVYVVAACL